MNGEERVGWERPYTLFLKIPGFKTERMNESKKYLRQNNGNSTELEIEFVPGVTAT
jgi:hypothetical protein